MIPPFPEQQIERLDQNCLSGYMRALCRVRHRREIGGHHTKSHVGKALDDWPSTKHLAKTVAELSDNVKEVTNALRKEPVSLRRRPGHSIHVSSHAFATNTVMYLTVCSSMERLTLYFPVGLIGGPASLHKKELYSRRSKNHSHRKDTQHSTRC